MVQQAITIVSIFLMLSGYIYCMAVAPLKDIVIKKTIEFITHDPTYITNCTMLPHELSSTIIQHLIAINKRKSALPILLLSSQYYQQQHMSNKQNHLRLLLANNQQVELTLEQSKQLIQASAPIQNLIQDIENHVEEIPLPLLTQEQVSALLLYMPIINALNASTSTLPMLQQDISEAAVLSHY